MSEEDSEEEWIRTNSIQNRFIHEHHDQQRDLQLNNYRRAQASRLNYYPLNSKAVDEVTTSSTVAGTSSSSSGNSPSDLRPEQNSISDRYVYNSVQERDDDHHSEGKLIEGKRRIQTTPFSFASKFTFDSRELPTLYGRPNNDEKIREALLFTSSERDTDEDDEDDDDSDSSEEEDEDDDEDEYDDDVEIDQIFQNNLKFLKDKIESERRRRMNDAPTIPQEKHEEEMIRKDEGNMAQPDAPPASTTNRRDPVNMNGDFDLYQSDDSALARLKWSSSAEVSTAEEDKVRQVPSTSAFPTTSSSPSPPSPPTSTPSPSTTTSPSSSSSSSSTVKTEEEQVGDMAEVEEEEETAAGTDMTSSPSSQINHKCPLQCKNGGWCGRDGRFSGVVSDDELKTSQGSVAGSGTDEESLEEKLAGYRCLCPMGYRGSFCEIGSFFFLLLSLSLYSIT